MKKLATIVGLALALAVTSNAEFLNENGIRAAMPGKIRKSQKDDVTLYMTVASNDIIYMVSFEDLLGDLLQGRSIETALTDYIYAWISNIGRRTDDLEVYDYQPDYESTSYTCSEALDGGGRLYSATTVALRGKRAYRLTVCTTESKARTIAEHDHFIKRVLITLPEKKIVSANKAKDI